MIGDNIRKLLHERGMSVRELARAIDEPQRTVQEIIAKNRVPRDLSFVRKVAQALDCTTHRIFFGEEDPNSPIERVTTKFEIHQGVYEIVVRKVVEKTTRDDTDE